MLPLKNYLAAHAALKGQEWGAQYADWLVAIEVTQVSRDVARSNWAVIEDNLGARFGNAIVFALRFQPWVEGMPVWIDLLIIDPRHTQAVAAAQSWIDTMRDQGGVASPADLASLRTREQEVIYIDARGIEQRRQGGRDTDELASEEWYNHPGQPGDPPDFTWTRWTAVASAPPAQAPLALLDGSPLPVPPPARDYGTVLCTICEYWEGEKTRIASGWHCHYTGEHVCDRHVRVVENEDERMARESKRAIVQWLGENKATRTRKKG